MTVTEDLYQKFLADAKQQFGFDVDRIKEYLKKHRYSGFRINMIDVYMAVLKQEWNELDEQKIQREQEKVEQPRIYPTFEAIVCPVCGAKTVGDLLWYGKFTHKQSWRCTKGGLAHFLWAKANECRVEQGLQPLLWEVFSAEYQHPYISVSDYQNP